MNHEHKDKPHVYIKENKIVVQQDDQVISLNLSHAQMLVQELIEADQVLRRMEEKKKSVDENEKQKQIQNYNMKLHN